MNTFGEENYAAWRFWVFLGRGATGEVCCGILVDCFKEEKTSTFFFADFLPQTSPHTRTT